MLYNGAPLIFLARATAAIVAAPTYPKPCIQIFFNLFLIVFTHYIFEI
jgi:hypothetical protein